MSMNGDSNGIFVLDAGNEVFVRVVGRGTYQNSQPLRQHVVEKIQCDCRTFIVDLGGCLGMDSTFLGVLAGFGLSLRHGGQNGQLHILNANDRNRQSLCALGLDRVLQLSPTDPFRPLPPEREFQKLTGSDVSEAAKTLEKQTTAKLMLDAHEALCRADENNEVKFKDVKQCLRDKLNGQNPSPENKN